MLEFKIAYWDDVFQLIVALDGEEHYVDAVPYCSVSSVCVLGKVYGAYLTGSEPDLDKLDGTPDAELVTRAIKVYSLDQWPAITAIDAPVTLIDAADEDEEEDGEGEDEEVIPLIP